MYEAHTAYKPTYLIMNHKYLPLRDRRHVCELWQFLISSVSRGTIVHITGLTCAVDDIDNELHMGSKAL